MYFYISSESKCCTQIDLRREGMYFYISSESKCISSLPILVEIKTTMHIINSSGKNANACSVGVSLKITR
jgi:hypothetical protein